MKVEHWWNDNWQSKIEELQQKHVPVSVFSPQITHALAWH
jgi:hypothetical protein